MERQHWLKWQLGRISSISLVLQKRNKRMDLKDIVSSLERVRLRFGLKFLWSLSMTVGKSPIPGQKSKLDFGRRMMLWKRLMLMFILAPLGWSKKSSARKVKNQDSFDAFNNDESVGDFHCRVMVWTVPGSSIDFWSRLLAFYARLSVSTWLNRYVNTHFAACCALSRGPAVYVMSWQTNGISLSSDR